MVSQDEKYYLIIKWIQSVFQRESWAIIKLTLFKKYVGQAEMIPSHLYLF